LDGHSPLTQPAEYWLLRVFDMAMYFITVLSSLNCCVFGCFCHAAGASKSGYAAKVVYKKLGRKWISVWCITQV